jgi:hypothetical protein
VVEGSYAADQQPGVAFVGVTGDQVGEGLAVAADRCPQAAMGFGLPLGRTSRLRLARRSATAAASSRPDVLDPALLAARRAHEHLEMSDFTDSLQRIVLDAELGALVHGVLSELRPGSDHHRLDPPGMDRRSL